MTVCNGYEAEFRIEGRQKLCNVIAYQVNVLPLSIAQQHLKIQNPLLHLRNVKIFSLLNHSELKVFLGFGLILFSWVLALPDKLLIIKMFV